MTMMKFGVRALQFIRATPTSIPPSCRIYILEKKVGGGRERELMISGGQVNTSENDGEESG
jgi:hypothetical protein